MSCCNSLSAKESINFKKSPLNLQDKMIPFQFPDLDHNYGKGDTGWSKYLAKSLYNTNQIVLTFDDGPHPTRTPKLLDILKEFNAKATFFVLANKINKSTIGIIERIVREGHTLASHDWDHSNSNKQPEELFKQNLKRAIRKIKQIQKKYGSKQKNIYYRFPYAAYGHNKNYHHMNVMKEVSNELFGENCINFVFWDIDTADWVSNMTSTNIIQTIKANMEGGIAYRHAKINGKFEKKSYIINSPIEGGVVLMHDIHARSVNSVRGILEYTKDRGIEIIPLYEVEEYLYEKNKQCKLK
jgi:peptidoglycan/xylan/chitin deacetylase (PgdA/CDA1 family)